MGWISKEITRWFCSKYPETETSSRRLAIALMSFNLLMILMLSCLILAYSMSGLRGQTRAAISASGIIALVIASLILLKAGHYFQAVCIYFFPTMIGITVARYLALVESPHTVFSSYLYYNFYMIAYAAVFGRRWMVRLSSVFFITMNLVFYFLIKENLDPISLEIATTGIYNSTPALFSIFVVSWWNIRLTDQRTRELYLKNQDLDVENKKNSSLKNIIRQYIPRTTWEKADLNSQQAIMELPEESRIITCFFLDVVDFTPFAENHSPADVINHLNVMFKPIVDTIYENGGDIDKFIGDAIFAIFPDTESCMKAACKIQERMKSRVSARIRIGINTGPVIVGNIGGSQRKDNTFIGDMVNIASRIEKMCLPGEIVYTASVAALIRDAYPPYMMETVTLKGKGEPTVMYRYKV